MGAHSALQRKPQVTGIGKYTCRTVVYFVFGEAIQTLHISGFFPDIVARAEWAFSVSNHGVH